MDDLELLSSQLGRMRGMTRFYHERFFSDVRYVTLTTLGLFVLGWAVTPAAFLLVPVVALIGANQTAFDASYLLFARHYAAALEARLNAAAGKRWLLGSALEDTYLFPLDKQKLVTIRAGSEFSWFGWMTVFYTLTGVLALAGGIGLGWETLTDAGTGWILFYFGGLAVLAIGSMIVGIWWFVDGEGERRLGAVLDEIGSPADK